MNPFKRQIIAVDVYFEKHISRVYVGQLKYEKKKFVFNYDDTYLYSERAMAIGPDLPCTQKRHASKKLFMSFEDRIPSRQNPAYPEYCQMTGISSEEKDPLVLLATIGQKGAVFIYFCPCL